MCKQFLVCFFLSYRQRRRNFKWAKITTLKYFWQKGFKKKLIISYWEACGQVSSINPFKITMFKKKKSYFQ